MEELVLPLPLAIHLKEFCQSMVLRLMQCLKAMSCNPSGVTDIRLEICLKRGTNTSGVPKFQILSGITGSSFRQRRTGSARFFYKLYSPLLNMLPAN